MLKNKIRYLVIVVLTGLLAILYNEYFMGIIFLTIIVLPFFIFGMLCYIYGRVSAELLSSVHIANKGQFVPVTVQLNNPTIFPVSNITIVLKYKNSISGKEYKKEITLSIDRKTKTAVTCNLLSEHTGNLVINLSKIRIFDYLQVFSLRKKLTGEIKIAIMPYFRELTEDYLSSHSRMLIESDYYSNVRSGDDPSEVFAVREYREGDRQQRIHWKLSMKQDQLMIKEFSEPLNCSTLIFADFSINYPDDVLFYMDALMENALSLSYTFLKNGQIHYLSWYDKSHGTCRRIRIVQEKDLYEAVDGLLQSVPYTESIDAVTAYLAEHPNDKYTDLFYITDKVTKEKLETLSFIKANARQIILVNDVKRSRESHKSSDAVIPMSEEIINHITEMGIGLMSLDSNNIISNLEQLKLS